jgi:hypothetical protein
MNQRTPLTLALFLLVFVSSLAPVVAQNKSPKDKPVAANADPFSVVIAAEWPSEKVGSDLTVVATITNTSTKRITIIDTQRFCDYTVDVRDDAGDVPPTDKWRQKINCEGVEISGRRIIRELKPNESYSDPLILKQWYEMNHPGKYQVQIGRKIPDQLGKGWVKSNMIILTVTE